MLNKKSKKILYPMSKKKRHLDCPAGNNQIILITGAAGRLGSAIAKGIVADSARVALFDSDKKRLFALANELGPDSCFSFHGDCAQPKITDSCINATLQKFGRIDGAVHCAYPRSSGWGASLENLKKNNLDIDLSAQLGGAIIFSQRILKYFKAQGYGNLIHIASIMGVTTPKFENYVGTKMTSVVEYTAIKAGQIAMTRYLAKYYKGNNIRVNCVSPGGILDQQPETFLRRYREACNDKGMLDPSDIVGTILYLLSENSRYVTGQNIIVDDGWSL